MRDVWPQCQILLYAEYFCCAEQSDGDIDPAQLTRYGWSCAPRNASMTLALFDADHGIAPTAWQASRFPATLRRKITVLHKGIATDLLCPA